MYMLLLAVMCAKPLCHRNVNIKLYINQIYVNTIIHREFTFGISCVTILKYTLILSPQFRKTTENKTSNQKEN
jgi:hypothetical protein